MKHLVNALHIAALFMVSLPVILLGLVAVPIALLFCKPEDEHLPRWAWPWDNAADGINGDGDAHGGWRGPEHANGRERTFWWRFVWLALRNPVHNFGVFLLGWKCSNATRYRVWGDSRTSNMNPGHPGSMYCEGYEAGRTWPCYYLVWRWSENRCVRAYFGWKNKNFASDGRYVQFVAVFNPFMTFRE